MWIRSVLLLHLVRGTWCVLDRFADSNLDVFTGRAFDDTIEDEEQDSDHQSTYLLWTIISFDHAPMYEEPIVRLKSRPHQLYFRSNASVQQTPMTCHLVVPRSQFSVDPGPSDHLVAVHFYCSSLCCDVDCCQINTTALLLLYFVVFTGVVYTIYLCSSEKRRKAIARKIFHRRRPIQRRNAQRQPKWRDPPRISVTPPTRTATPHIVVTDDDESHSDEAEMAV